MGSEVAGTSSQILEWGSLGLLLVMLGVILTALLVGNMTASKEQVLKSGMYAVALCFLAALGAKFLQGDEKHSVMISFLPEDLQVSDFPSPALSVNGETVEASDALPITEDSRVSVDLSGAVGAFLRASAEAQTSAEKAEEIEAKLVAMTEELEEQVGSDSEAVAALTEERDALMTALEEAEATLESQAEAYEVIETRTSALSSEISSIQRQLRSTGRTTSAPARQVQEAEKELRSIETFGTGVFR